MNGGKASDVLKALEKDIMRFLTQQALQGIKNSIFGGAGTGTDIFSLLFKGIGLLSGTPAPSGLGYGSVTGDIFPPGLPYANGTKYHPGGLAWVGEHGPELLNLGRGASVSPMRSGSQWNSGERSNVIYQTVQVQQGGNTQSAMQVAAMLRDATFRAVKNRN